MTDTEPTRAGGLSKDHHGNVPLVPDVESIHADAAETRDRPKHASPTDPIVVAETGAPDAVITETGATDAIIAETGAPDAIVAGEARSTDPIAICAGDECVHAPGLSKRIASREQAADRD
jgi:hypothetical protein